ncbi:hypothetical protein L1049_018218 [Liquidambar formosana]|uniref:Protein FAR1-RELATED SEQUENCE n=1 Tax=Liquidambar formosana TaxID=63359 RepID=A0AAP0R9R4_LIQFO
MDNNITSTSVDEINIGDNSTHVRSEERDEGVEPKVGMKFNSEEEVRTFYSKYATIQGFGIAKISVKGDDEGKPKYFSLACSRNGNYVSTANSGFNPRPSTKTGCKAKINVVVRSDGVFVISKVSINHNHGLSPSKSRHRKLDSAAKRILDINDQATIELSESSLVISASGHERVSNNEKDCRNSIAKVRNSRLGVGDAEAVCKFFKRMQQRNPNFYHVMDFDEEGRLRNLFWADARSRAAYESFLDVVSFDTTYMTNEYGMPLTPFVGVNHHGQSILFGCGLLSCKDIDTYIWLFRNWLECMSWQAPKVIVTDQCKSIQAAVREVFPNTQHCLCLKQIMRKIPENLRRFNEYKKIKRYLKSIVYESITINEFERRWAEMIDEFDLRQNEWLASLYNDRKQWVPLFMKETFGAGMLTTQHSKSMNLFFDGCVNSKTTLKQFVEQYDQALKRKVENESLADSSSFNSKIPLISHFGFEKQFQEVYTNDIFKQFQSEIRGMVYCNVSFVGSDGHVSTFQVSDVSKGEDGITKKVVYNVQYNEDQFEVLCLCRLFEFMGIICRHIIKVLVEKNVNEVPDQYILDRWKKDIKRTHTYVTNCYDDLGMKEQHVRQRCLYSQFSQISEMAVESAKMYEFVMKNLQLLHERMLSNDCCFDDANEGDCSDLPICSPLKVRSNGRPPMKRKESKVCMSKSNKGRKVVYENNHSLDGTDTAPH